jgi:hypothetical protein
VWVVDGASANLDTESKAVENMRQSFTNAVSRSIRKIRTPVQSVTFNRILAITGATALIACASTPTLPPFDGSLPLGTWGSDSAALIVGDTAMHIHIKCTFGDVSGRVPLAADGSFDVAGSYMLRAYPITIGPAVPARFVGRVRDGEVTVTVTVNDTVEHKTVVLGPVSATYGKEAHLWPCPICRRPILTRGTMDPRNELRFRKANDFPWSRFHFVR